VGSQVIQHDADKLNFWEDFVHQPFHAMSKVFLGVFLRHPNMTLVRQGYEEHMQISNPMPLILLTIRFRLPCWAGKLSRISPIKARLHSS
jgi:hypothetical protein